MRFEGCSLVRGVRGTAAPSLRERHAPRTPPNLRGPSDRSHQQGLEGQTTDRAHRDVPFAWHPSAPSRAHERDLRQLSSHGLGDECSATFENAPQWSTLSCSRRSLTGVFFSLSSWELGLFVFAFVAGASALGVLAGRYLRHSDAYREPVGALQGALLGVVGLILAFGLTLAVGRYENRRADVVTDANTIGTAYLRAQTIAEPQRSRSLALLLSYNDLPFGSRTRSREAQRCAPPPPVRGGCSSGFGDSRARR